MKAMLGNGAALQRHALARPTASAFRACPSERLICESWNVPLGEAIL